MSGTCSKKTGCGASFPGGLPPSQKIHPQGERHLEKATYLHNAAAASTLAEYYDTPPMAYVHSYGCQQNVNDGEKLKGVLQDVGFGICDSVEQADLILFNTCAVREHAEQRVFGNVGALKKLKEKNPRLIIGVCGCMAQQKQVVDKLLHAKHIYILGVRSSSFLAGYLNFYMHLIFENVTLVQSSAAGEIYEQLVHIGPGDVLLSICFPRYSKMAIHAVQFACSRKADVIAITDSPMSPMYQMATLSLLAPSDMISFVDSMAAPLSLLNALILAVGRQRREELSATLADMEQVWSKYSIFGKEDDE